MSDTVASETQTYQGRVKWFNNKAGYGFITVIGSDLEGTDIFAHHSNIKVSEEQYKYLVQGEYLEFTLISLEKGDHKFQAGEISGVKGGKLLCETRNEVRASAPKKPVNTRVGDKKASKPRKRGSGPREAENSDEEWVLVKKTVPSSSVEEA